MLSALCKLIFKIVGWKAIDYSERLTAYHPPVTKFVMIVAPHTSNWDFMVALIARYILGYGNNTKFLGKHTLFKPPYGWLFYALGGTPVNRTQHNNLTEQVAAKFAQATGELGVVIAPEGTRKYTNQWKKGFYYIALKANVPILPVCIDYKNKVISVHPPFFPSGNAEADIAQLKKYYRKDMALYPEHYASGESAELMLEK
ncbi:MAG: 1-acyl-sn-glycerol-3-phosphate acyltransferase [Cytophagales bacterium]|nr:1-acyl-sn-glycerol-3-phosphate acyltransferase [Bernardetiaceae bacterium]MDW8205241.1 1-acyl-sn-glycerol-3-phosphate acyltransferase [Cytophagales bacterium]